MVVWRMGSQGSGSDNIGGTQIQTLDLKSYPLARLGSFYNLTLDEVQSQLGDLGKPLSSMNLDELLKTLWTAEANNQFVEGVDNGSSSQQPISVLSLDRQSSLTLSRDLSKKTVDEVWQDIQQEPKRSNLDRKATLGEMTLEDFFVKAGVVADTVPGKKNSGSVLRVVDPMGLAQQGQWMKYHIPSINPQQQQSMLPVYMPDHTVQHPVPLGGNPIMDTAYPETLITMSSSPLVATLSGSQPTRRKRAAPDDIAEKSVERRQKRMIKNREAAARSRARKQAYTHELENKVSHLEEENERLKKLQEWEKALPSIPLLEPKYQLRRTSSAPI